MPMAEEVATVCGMLPEEAILYPGTSCNSQYKIASQSLAMTKFLVFLHRKVYSLVLQQLTLP